MRREMVSRTPDALGAPSAPTSRGEPSASATLRPVSYLVPDVVTVTPVRVDRPVKKGRSRRSVWRWPAMVWSVVAITAILTRGMFAASLAALTARASTPAAAPVSSAAPVTRDRHVTSRDLLRRERTH